MKKMLIFAGTSEGRMLAEQVEKQNIEVHICVATEYGKEILQKNHGYVVYQGRLESKEMETLIQKENWMAVVDATHPYALKVSENIKKACETIGIKYLRLLRKNTPVSEEDDKVSYFGTKEEAAAYLNRQKGNILFTTGSKELEEYVSLIEKKERIYVRILSNAKGIESCMQMGLSGKQIICMQGPFLAELNAALLKQINAKYMVTKDTGENGGFLEKIEGSKLAGAKAVVIKRPVEESGYTVEELLRKWNLKYIKEKRNITLAGIGIGTQEGMTLEVHKACQNADLILGADRLLKTVEPYQKEMISMYQPEKIKEFIEKNENYRNILILLSGDVGFYSGAKKLLETFSEEDNHIHLLCGISSMVYFCAKLKIPWEDIAFASIHGRKQNVIQTVKQNEKTFLLVGGSKERRKLSKDLLSCQLGYVQMYVGYQLSYPEEKIISGNPEKFLEDNKEGLSVIVIINKKSNQCIITHGRKDDLFIRGNAPMTKEEIRSICLSKLALTKNAVVYDIGAGTGSIAIECALQAVQGTVYAIEKKEEAQKLLIENKYHLGAENVEIIKGSAPEMLKELKAPTHAFIGGSGGSMVEIVEAVLCKNPQARIVITAITLETISDIIKFVEEKRKEFSEADIVQVSIGKAKEQGDYHLMMGQNPVYIVTLEKRGE